MFRDGGREVTLGVNLAYGPAAVRRGVHRNPAVADEKERWWDE